MVQTRPQFCLTATKQGRDACATSDAPQAKRTRHENTTKCIEIARIAIPQFCFTATTQGRVAYTTSDALQAKHACHENVAKLLKIVTKKRYAPVLRAFASQHLYRAGSHTQRLTHSKQNVRVTKINEMAQNTFPQF